MFSLKLTLVTVGAVPRRSCRGRHRGIRSWPSNCRGRRIRGPRRRSSRIAFGCRQPSDGPDGGCGRLDVAVGAAGREVRQPAIEGIADPAAEGGKPAARGFASRCSGGAVDAALDARPVEVAFDAVDDRADLVVVAKRAADQCTLRLDAGPGRERPIRGAEAVAGVDADVEAGPVVVGDHRTDSLVEGPRNVGCLGRERGRQREPGREPVPRRFQISSSRLPSSAPLDRRR